MPLRNRGWLWWTLGGRAGADAPPEWIRLYRYLQTFLKDKYIAKIELVAFVIKGTRKARWTLPTTDPEYCTEREAMQVARKLAWLLLLSRTHTTIAKNSLPYLKCTERNTCKLLEGHSGACSAHPQQYQATSCPICARRIHLSDFDRNGRKDPDSIQNSHRSPLSRIARGHNAKNVAWAHRVCNQLQGEQSLNELIERMKDILEAQGYTVS